MMDSCPVNSIQETNEYLKCVYQGCRHVVSLYQWAPLEGTLNIRSFQEIAAKRLALLQYIDENYRGAKIRTSNESNKSNTDNKSTNGSKFSNFIEEKMENFGFMMNKNSIFQSTEEERLKLAQIDIISHFILRLAFAKDWNKKEWFLKQESRLLEFRLEHLKASKLLNSDGMSNLDLFLTREEIDYQSIQRPSVINGILYSSPEYQLWSDFMYQKKDSGIISKLYLVPFYPDGMTLVKNHKVAINNMTAYVPYDSLIQALVTKFKHSLNQSLVTLDTNMDWIYTEIFSDERLGPFLRALPSTYLANDYDKALDIDDGTRLTISNINKIYKITFPPCMRRIFEQYLVDGKMKHWARQQLWLFFKGAGLGLEESLNLNRSIWSNASSFDKEHRYNIRHMYGQEGRRVAYPPYSCSKIISVLPPPTGGSTHGCPFKLYDKHGLTKMLKGFGLRENQVESILEHSTTHQYQLACVEYHLQICPNSSGDGVGNHPNAFFNAAIKSLSKPEDPNIVKDKNIK